MANNNTAPDNWESLLTHQEKQAYADFFNKVDQDNKSIVLQDEAMAFFQKSNIPSNILKQFWDASDNDKKGFLTLQEFCTVLKFIACAQHEVTPSDPILATSVALPQFNGNGYSGPSQQQQQSAPPPLPTNRPLGGSTPDLVSPEDRAKYISLFQSFGAENNILNGEKARDSFIRSRLPPETLQRIWTLADTRQSGTLNQTEFIIAMHYIERCMKGLGPLPPSLPPAVYASATGRTMYTSPLMRHNTIATPQRLPTSPVFKGAPMPQQTNVVDISPDEYNKYKTFFHQLNVSNLGYISGADAVVFFKHSKLDDADLARIWDLADTNSTGQLTEQEFVFAMYLINRRVAGGEIPATAPQMKMGGTSLLAPGGHPQQQQQQQQQQHHQQQQQQQQQPIADLLGLSSETTDTVIPTSPQQQPQQSHFNSTDFTSTQASLQSSIQQESTRNQLAQSQYHNESQAVQELERQIASQKEALAKIKQEAEEAEKELAAEKEKKEKLTKELQMYRQETKHFSTRAENAQEETKQVKKEIEELEKSRKAATVSPLQLAASPTFNNTSASPTASHNDFFTLSSATPSLFAKVEDASSTPASLPQAMSPSSSSQKSYDPFAGFKAHQEKKGSPTPSAASLNHLKEETEKKKSVGSPNVDISDIESKFPDLSTMEQNFQMPTSPSLSTTSQKKPEPVSSPKSTVSASAAGKKDDSLFKPSKDNIFGLVDKPKTSDVFPEKPTTASSSSKYGFDLSAFEPSTSTQSGNMSVKDELSSLFGGSQTEEKPAPNFSDAFSSEKPAEKPTNNGFDDIFGAPAATNKTNSFEDIFFQK